MSKTHETLKKYILADGFRPIFDPIKSHGAYFVDADNGKEYLDLFSFFATQTVGYNHPKMNTPELREKLALHGIHRPTLSDIYTPEHAEFIDTFAKMTDKNIFKHFYFVEGGTLGVENALKVAFDWKVRKNLAHGKGEKGSKIIHFKNAFHGRSGYAVSMTNTSDANKYKYFAKFDWPRITSPALTFPLTDASIAATIEKEKVAIAEIKQALQDYPDDIAALIIEPIQCEGGDKHFRNEFFKELRTLADENEFLLIFDEVQTGIGLTGKMWGYEHTGVEPDIIAFGKKVQVAGCAATSRIDDISENVFNVSSRINSTWGGNLIDMIRCTHYLRIIEEDCLLENVVQTGTYLLQKLNDLSQKDSRISNVRGKGLLIAFDLENTQKRNQMIKNLFEAGAIVLGSGDQSIRLRPHLDFTKENADHALELFIKSIPTS